jgi:hypothetical protein
MRDYKSFDFPERLQYNHNIQDFFSASISLKGGYAKSLGTGFVFGYIR